MLNFMPSSISQCSPVRGELQFRTYSQYRGVILLHHSYQDILLGYAKLAYSVLMNDDCDYRKKYSTVTVNYKSKYIFDPAT